MLVSAAVALLLYGLGWRRLRARRVDLAPVWKAVAFAAGVVVVVFSLLSPLDPIGEEFLFFAHMLQHILLSDLGPLLLAVGLTGPLSLFAVPRPVLRLVGRRRPLRALARFITSPMLAVVLWSVVMIGWHLPVAFVYAIENRWAHDLEHASMFIAGFLVWLVLTGSTPRRALSYGRRSAIAVGLLVISTVISQTIFVLDPLYSIYIDQPERLFGWTPKGDQVRAALLMHSEQLLTLGAAAGILLWAHVERTHDEQKQESEESTSAG